MQDAFIWIDFLLMSYVSLMVIYL